MAEVKKREKVPEEFKPVEVPRPKEEPVIIKVGDKEYPLPEVTLKQYKKLLKDLEGQKEDMTELESLQFTQDFYYKLLKPHYPELKKTDMDDMPMFQYSAEFVLKLKLALYRVPLA